MSKQVKNISGQRLSVIGVGVAEPEEVISVPDDFNNPNFELVSSGAKAESQTESKEDNKDSKSKVDSKKDSSNK